MTDQYPYRYEPVPPQGPLPASQPTSQLPASPYGAQPYPAQPYPEQPYAPLPPAAPSPRRHLLVGFGSGAIAAALVIGGVALAQGGGSSAVAGAGSFAQLAPGTSGQGSLPNGTGGTTGGTTGGGTSGTTAGGATATQQVGIVTIVSTLKYQNAQSAGTGMILSSDGEILTNNHVINGATSIVVTVQSTGRSYKADVVGTAPSSDVAVVKLENASGLQKAKLAASASDVKVGDSVVGVGNAGGTGTLSAAAGKVTALDQSITASDEGGADAEKLTGLIETDAPIISGDSGGPLYNSAGKVVGIDTAASTTRRAGAASAYAIPIEKATGIAAQIEAGNETTSIHLGLPGFLGVQTQAANGAGAGVAGLLDGGPAAAAGITAGAVITKVDGTAVTSPESLRAALVGHDPGTKVSVTWVVPTTNQTRNATVTLGTGPAD